MVINPPVYDSFFPWVAEVGCRLVEVPLGQTGDGWALDLDAMQAAFQDGARVHLLCSPHNPTGTVHQRQDLERLAVLAARYGVTVLADEIHAPLVLSGRTHHPFVLVSQEAARHGMVFTSASKAWNLAGLKCAAIVTGVRLAKEHKHSRRRIDAAVAAVMAVHRACELARVGMPAIYV